MTIRQSGKAGPGRRPAPEPIGEACPEGGEPLVKRQGKHDPFIGCSAYPACRYTRSEKNV